MNNITDYKLTPKVIKQIKPTVLERLLRFLNII